MSLANCSCDEHKKYKNGKAGDQTGAEFAIVPFYNRPWNVVLRYPDKSVAKLIAAKMRACCKNEHIGYDQNERLSFWNILKNTPDYDPSRIKVDVEADCSSAISSVVCAVGWNLNIRKLKDISPALTTRSMRKAFVNAGFHALVDSVYTKSDRFLLPGDVLLLEGYHTATNLDRGNGDNDPVLAEIAKLVMDGRYGNGSDRKKRLAEDFPQYGYSQIQACVNLLSWR